MLQSSRSLICLVIVLLVSSGCRPSSDQVPDHLIGTWQTSTGTHAGSTIEITKKQVLFASNRDVDIRARIVGFKSVLERSQTVYQLSYQDQYKNEYQLLLLYDPTEGGTVTLRNQPHILWKRMGANS
jgi:hypothetical protein